MQGFDQMIRHFIREQTLFTAGSRILIACSGGVDSMVLLHYFAANRKEFQVSIGAVHVDHMMRGEASAAEGEFVKGFCEAADIPFYGGRVPVPEILKEAGGNVQMICREGRYAFFEEVMRKFQYDVLAIAHHAEDQLETVLMQVTKGNQPLGMPIKRKLKEGMLVRPFLPVDKAALYLYAKDNAVPFREDPSNQSNDYMRNRFRHSIVPHMVLENNAVAQNVVSVTDELQQDEELLQALTKERLASDVELTEEGFPAMDVKVFNSMPTALQRRAIPLLLNYLYDKENRDIFYKYDLIRQLLEHLRSHDGNVTVDLPLGFRFIREYDKFTFSPPHIVQDKHYLLPKGKKVKWDQGSWLYWNLISEAKSDDFLNATEITFFNLPEESLPLTIRQRKEGDRILLSGMSHAKRLSRLFIDEKVGRTIRERLPVVVTKQDEVCAVPGLRYGRSFTKQQTADSKYIFVVGNN